MGERTEHKPGTFSWVDIATTDQEGAKAFYSGLFGWETEDLPAGDGISYSMARIGGKAVAAIAPQPQQQRDAGVPPMWNSYVTVASADDAAAKAQEAGATVHAPPFDVLDAGRMAVIQDPTGAFFMVWESKQSIGAECVNEPGTLTWNELHVGDPEAAAGFYSQLFGWTTQDIDMGDGRTYRTVYNGERMNGGILPHPQGPQAPPYWLPYFVSEDAAATLTRAEELGGSTAAAPMQLPTGATIAVAQDPQGAYFALFEGETED